jgi:hypothetical protein
MSVDHFSGDRHMTPVKPLMKTLSWGVARLGALRRPVEAKWPSRAVVGTAFVVMGTLFYAGYTDRHAHTPRAEPPSAHEEAVKQDASPSVDGPIVVTRALRLLDDDTRPFERLVMPEGFEEWAP